ncbi:protein-(glutamine-N5) methyltransferase, release factor-specific [Paramesorhizobium deserti]|uniref:Release factor glutamine methyltransferase n=1 Tax=Paramesorhizobium deserti TaxID=1494590 RepID=A0A135I1S9_9HYPH|nr:peptide chain release factor N(5)-glutamine methyltransferase [Paramesorhizobium deserti]KXF79396.1 protein-(glutamine-N5) methyltransferase, release factor-specific [Paramesorhizobium deserti]
MGGEALAALHGRARKVLREAGIATPEIDARLLVEWATGTTRLDALSRPERIIPSDAVGTLDRAIERRLKGEPVYRIMGERSFYGLGFRLSPETLEPRPDTETLVDLVLPFLKQRVAENGVADVIDLGTGTGAIAIALLSQLEGLRAVGVDIAPGALAIARENALAAGVSRRFAALRSDWFAAVTGKFDLIVSNPPYIPRHVIATLDREVREHDPLLALDGGEDGLDFYKALASGSGYHLYEGGAVGVEIGAGQLPDVESIFAKHGFRLIEISRDLSGHERALLFRL